MSTLKSRQVGTISILTPKGYLTGGEETEELERAIKGLAEEGNKHLVINLSETQHLNSTALGVLISAHRRLSGRDGRLVIACDVPAVLNTFKITGLDGVLEIVKTRDDALDPAGDGGAERAA